MGSLLDILDSYCLGNNEMEDERIWLLDETHGFSVKSFYGALAQGELSYFPTKFIWNPLAPSPIPSLVFLVAAMVGQGPHYGQPYLEGGFISLNRCCMCCSEFMYCQILAALWDYVLVRFKIQWVLPRSVKMLMACWPY